MQGAIVNGYQLKRLLGEGGMAEVWYAENQIRKPAAVKILYERMMRSEQIVDRFHNEALAMVKLSHPNICQVYDYGYIGNRHCIIMEYLEGDDLGDLMQQGRRFTDAELRRWWNQAVDALSYTHAQGIVHRDIKPSNLFLDKDGNIKLLDFGIAKMKENASLTQTGTVMGTPMYMSPEQVRNTKNVDYRTDLYSLAVTFVHLLTGRKPYDDVANSAFDIQLSILNKPLDLSRVPAPWRGFLAPYLNKEPSKRPALKPIDDPYSKSTSAHDDDNSKQGSKSTANSQTGKDEDGASKQKQSIVPWVIAGVACVAAIILVLLLFIRGNSNNGDKGYLAEVNDGIQETNMMLSKQIYDKYSAFELSYSMNEEKVIPYWKQATSLRTEANELISYLETMKWDLVRQVEGVSTFEALKTGVLERADTIYNGHCFFDINTAKLKSGDNISKPAKYLVNAGKTTDLKEKVRHFRGEVVRIVGQEHEREIGMNADFDFSNSTLVADVIMLNKMITEVQNAEIGAVTVLMQDVHADDFKFDAKSAQVFAESNYIVSGQTYRAQVMVTAWESTKATARISLDGGPEKVIESDGQGVIDLNFNVGVGTHTYTGSVEMLDPSTNTMEIYSFANKFTVAPPSIAVSATKMNVVYAGIDNPISIGGGVGGEISASASGASLTRTGNGTYNLRVNPGHTGDVVVTVSSHGSSLGSMKFRVKELPKPTAKIDNVIDGKVSKSALLAANMVKAEVKDFDFDGIHYDVVGYTFKYKTKAGTTKEEKVSGFRFNETLRSVLNSANTGDIFVFSAIQVKGNDGRVKVLDSQIAVEIK